MHFFQCMSWRTSSEYLNFNHFSPPTPPPAHVSDQASFPVHCHKLVTLVSESRGVTMDLFIWLVCVSLLDATEDSAELPIINLLVDDGWHSFVPLPKLPAWPRLPAQRGCWQEQLFDVNGRGGHLNKMYHGGSFDVSDEVCHLFGNNWYIYQLCILLLWRQVKQSQCFQWTAVERNTCLLWLDWG